MTSGPLLFICVFLCVRQSMESMPSCQDIFTLGDSLRCTACGAEINPRCRINLLDGNPAILAPYLEILRTTSLLACFYSDTSFLNPESHTIAICKPGSMCGSVRSGDTYIRGCATHNSAHTHKCSEDFCNHSFNNKDLDVVNGVLAYATTSTTISTTSRATTSTTTTPIPPTTKSTSVSPSATTTTTITTKTSPISKTAILFSTRTPSTTSIPTAASSSSIGIKTTIEKHTNVTTRPCTGNPSIVCYSENPFCPFFDSVTGICSTVITESSLSFFGRCSLYCNKCQEYCDVMAAKLTTIAATTTTSQKTTTTMPSTTSSDAVQFRPCQENPKFICLNQLQFCSYFNQMTGACSKNPLKDSLDFFHRCSLYCNRCEEYCDLVASFQTTTVGKLSVQETKTTTIEQAIRFNDKLPYSDKQSSLAISERSTTAAVNKSPTKPQSNEGNPLTKGIPALLSGIHNYMNLSMSSSVSPPPTRPLTPTPFEGYGVIVVGRR